MSELRACYPSSHAALRSPLPNNLDNIILLLVLRASYGDIDALVREGAGRLGEGREGGWKARRGEGGGTEGREGGGRGQATRPHRSIATIDQQPHSIDR